MKYKIYAERNNDCIESIEYKSKFEDDIKTHIVVDHRRKQTMYRRRVAITATPHISWAIVDNIFTLIKRRCPAECRLRSDSTYENKYMCADLSIPGEDMKRMSLRRGSWSKNWSCIPLDATFVVLPFEFCASPFYLLSIASAFL